MKRFKYLTLAALVAFAACDEGEETIVVPPVTGTVSGVVTLEGSSASGVSVTLSNGSTASTDGSGAYSFSGVAAGAYTVTISGFASDASFSATVKAVTISSAGQVATANFDGSYIRTSAILGAVSGGGSGLSGVTVSISGQSSASTTTDANGQYSFSGLRAGSYTVAMSGFDASMYSFSSTSSAVTLGVGASEVVSFSGSLLTTAKISGRLYIDENDRNDNFDGNVLEPNLSVANIAITIEGGSVNNTTTVQSAADGTFEFTDLAAGTYRVSIDNTDTDIPSQVTFGLASNETLVTVSTGATATVNWPFDIKTQAIKVGAFLGTDGSNPMTAPAKGWTINLYDTQANAATGGATGRIGTGSTGSDGYITFRFDRSSDVGPNSSTNDKVVFARSVNPPTNHAPNGETILEIKYDATDSLHTGDDVFDATNNQVVIGLTATESDGDILSGWNVVMRNNKDSTFATIAQTGTTSSKGIRYFTVAGPLNTYPDTLWVRLGDSQPGANGHGFAQAPTADEGSAANRSLMYIWNGLTSATDTIMMGTSVVTYTDVAVTMRAHHEADDSTDTPVRTGGDDFTASPNIDIELKRGSTVVGARTAAAAGTGLVTWPNVSVGTAITATAFSNSPTIDLLDSKTITFTVDGSDQTYTDATLKGNAGSSSYAYKFNNNTISGTIQAADATAAAGLQVKIMAHPDNIQPKAAADTTVKTSAGGVYTTTGIVREGPYIVMVMDSLTSAGDTVWAMLGAAADTADSGGSLNNAIMNFTATRMDTKISGVVVNDRDSDFNTLDPEEALSGVTVNLYRDNSGVTTSTDTLIATTVTDGNGAYSFTKLREANYIVKAVSPSNATVLRALSNTGAVTDTVVVHTAAASGGTTNQDNTRSVGNTSPPGQNDEFPRWSYTTGVAANDAGGAGAGGPNNGGATTDPAHFVHLFSTGTVKGKIETNAGAGITGVRVTLTRCQTLTGALFGGAASPPSPPAGLGAATCAKHGTPSPHIVNTDTDSSGNYTFSNLLEGVYVVEVAPATAGYSTNEGPDSTAANGDETMVATIGGNNDIETVADYVIS